MDSIELNEGQLICLASPVRGEVYEIIRSHGNASVSDIGRSMNRSPESLYYHVKALVQCGLVREHSRRPTARKPESVYQVASTILSLPDVSKNPHLAEITRRAVVAGMRRSERGYLRASHRAETDSEVRSLMGIIRAKARLKPDDLKEFMDMIERAGEFAKSHDSAEGVLVTWSSVVYPEVDESAAGVSRQTAAEIWPVARAFLPRNQGHDEAGHYSENQRGCC